MPPKKAAKKEEPLPEIPKELDVDLPTLKAKLVALRGDVQRSAAERAQAAVDRDAVERFYDVTRRDLREAELAVAAKERELETGAHNHAIEVRVYQQKAKHLEYEHLNAMRRVVAESGEEAKDEEQGHLVREAQLRAAKGELRSRIRAAEEANAEAIRQMQLLHEKNLQKMRQEFAGSLEALRGKYEARLAQLGADLSLRAKVELHEVEERRNLHIHQLTRAHEEAFAEMKRYYNDITRSNLELVGQLKAKIAEASGKAAANQRLVLEIAEENKRLSEPLQQALAERAALQADLKDASRDRQSLAYARERLSSLRGQLAELQRGHAALEARYAAVSREREELYAKFEATVRAAAARAEGRSAALEQRLAGAEAEHDAAAAATAHVVAVAQLDPAVVGMVAARLDEAVEGRNRAIRELQAAAARLTKAHDDAVRTLASKLVELGVPRDEASAGQELLAESVRAGGGTQALGLSASLAPALAASFPGPAGLLAAPGR